MTGTCRFAAQEKKKKMASHGSPVDLAIVYLLPCCTETTSWEHTSFRPCEIPGLAA